MKGLNSNPHIGIFGRRNVGKSALINALTGQEIAIVSEVAGTTTDPVKKTMEISGIGPVVLIDTAGIDDVNELGKKRIEKTQNVLKHIDLAIIVITDYLFDETEENIVKQLYELNTPFIFVNNKSDIVDTKNIVRAHNYTPQLEEPVIPISAKTGFGISELIEDMKQKMPVSAYHTHSLLDGIVRENGTVLLITPIDSAAPEGRLILPQVQTIRAILDADAMAVVIKEDKVKDFFNARGAEGSQSTQVDLVITDSQVFKTVAPLIPENIPLTSFSILLARFKGDYENYLKGTPQIENLKDGDAVLIMESCTHLTSCEDIGRVKIPKWLTEYTGKNLHFDFISGLTPIENIKKYALVVQCGGCMITKKQILNRLKPAVDAGIPITNYGMLIAYITGIFDRATKFVD